MSATRPSGRVISHCTLLDFPAWEFAPSTMTVPSSRLMWRFALFLSDIVVVTEMVRPEISEMMRPESCNPTQVVALRPVHFRVTDHAVQGGLAGRMPVMVRASRHQALITSARSSAGAHRVYFSDEAQLACFCGGGGRPRTPLPTSARPVKLSSSALAEMAVTESVTVQLGDVFYHLFPSHEVESKHVIKERSL